jgi:hypothetical protein
VREEVESTDERLKVIAAGVYVPLSSFDLSEYLKALHKGCAGRSLGGGELVQCKPQIPINDHHTATKQMKNVGGAQIAVDADSMECLHRIDKVPHDTSAQHLKGQWGAHRCHQDVLHSPVGMDDPWGVVRSGADGDGCEDLHFLVEEGGVKFARAYHLETLVKLQGSFIGRARGQDNCRKGPTAEALDRLRDVEPAKKKR